MSDSAARVTNSLRMMGNAYRWGGGTLQQPIGWVNRSASPFPLSGRSRRLQCLL